MSVFATQRTQNADVNMSLELVPNPNLSETTDLQTSVCADIISVCPQMNALLPAREDGASLVTQRFAKLSVDQLAGLMEDHDLCLRATKTDLKTTRSAMFTSAQLRAGARSGLAQIDSQVPFEGGTMSLHTRGQGQYVSFLRYT